MLPQIDVFGRPFSMYAIFCVLGIALAILIGTSRSKIIGIQKNDVLYAMLLSVVGLLVGGKILYIVSVIPVLWEYRQMISEHPAILKALFNGGFVFFGAVFGAVGVVYLYCKKYKLKLLPMLDTVAPGIPIAHAFGRLGCLSAGCCYGCSYNGPLALTFPEGCAAPAGTALFPIQPFESVLNIILFIALMLLGRRKRRDGLLFGSYLLFYSIIRFVLEFFRGDAERGILFGFSLSQWISLLLLPLAVYIAFIYHPKNCGPSDDHSQ
ncbi:MAG: prolipoprotein diacylglyceryl transferase [Clostridiales bacterium]|jgi:phosphatidylglycerol:prolipoprotein diacylglycerol transferase|nr:prolipoprotein diacylglyceryl transferase [Clostridiales bacterium]